MAEKILTSELVIKASDQSGQVFEKVGAKLDKLASAGRRIGGMSSQFQTLGNHVNGAAQKLDLLHSKMSRIESAGKSLSKVLGPLSGTMSAIAAFEVAKLTGEAARETVKATSEGAHERVRMQAAGMTPAEIKDAEEASAHLTGKFKSVSQTDIMDFLRNARSIVGSYKEAEELMDPLLKFFVVTTGAHPERREEMKETVHQLLKAQEIVGITQDMPRFVKDMGLLTKSVDVFGDTLKAHEFYDFAKYARAAGPGYSDEFLFGVAPTLMQEMGGKSAGEALASFYQQFVQGKMPLQTARLLQKYGMVDPKKIEFTKAGLLKTLLPGAVKGHDIANLNPRTWIQDVLIPTLRSHGAKPEEIKDLLDTLPSKRTAGQAIGIMANQDPRIEKDLALWRGAMGLEAADLFMSKDPGVAMRGVTEQFTNLLQAAGSPLAQPATDALNATAAALNNLYGAARQSPWTAGAALLGAGGAVMAGTAAAGYWAAKKAARFIRGGAGDAALEVPPEIAALKGALRGPAFNWLLPMSQLAGQHDLLTTTPTGEAIDEAFRRRIGVAQGPKVEGAADFNVEVTVKPSPEFSASVKSTVDGAINGVRINGVPASGTTGSLGKSMQEAGPGPY